jgi:hypothetical protein
MTVTGKPYRVLSDYDLFAVHFNIRNSDSKKILYEAVVRIVGDRTSNESLIYRTAEEAARSWGAFVDPGEPGEIDHHFYERDFEPVSIERIGQVDGIVRSDSELLASTETKRSFD